MSRGLLAMHQKPKEEKSSFYFLKKEKKKMRNLNTGDLFKAARMIKEMGIKEELKAFAENLDDNVNQKDAGIDLLMLIFSKVTETKSENLIYKFLAGPFEMEVEEVEKMDLFEMIETLFTVADVEKWKGLFQKALR